MYKCDNCGEIFEEPKIVTEVLSRDPFTTETLCVSPCCYDYPAPLKMCLRCGEFEEEDSLIANMCPQCQSDIIAEAINLIKCKFSKLEVLFLQEIIDNGDFFIMDFPC